MLASLFSRRQREKTLAYILGNLSLVFRVREGMRIAPLLVQPVLAIEDAGTDSLDDTSRSQGSFGSAGLL